VAQTADEHVDGTFVGPPEAALRQIEKLVARKNAPRTLAECVQQVELRAGDCNLRPLWTQKLAHGHVELPSCEGKNLDSYIANRLYLQRAAPQHRLDSCK
jgi:hypothetical protein